MPVRARSVSYVKGHLAQVVAEVSDGAGPVLITRKGATAAVIEDAEAYQRTQDALAMLKLVAVAKHAVTTGESYTHDEVFAAARQRLQERLQEQE